MHVAIEDNKKKILLWQTPQVYAHACLTVNVLFIKLDAHPFLIWLQYQTWSTQLDE
jgi:hypothetical protein